MATSLRGSGFLRSEIRAELYSTKCLPLTHRAEGSGLCTLRLRTARGVYRGALPAAPGGLDPNFHLRSQWVEDHNFRWKHPRLVRSDPVLASQGRLDLSALDGRESRE